MSLVWSPDYAPVDGDFADVSLLLKGEGTNGSTTILDSSSNNLSVTASGDAQIINTVATPFSPTVPSDGVLAFDGSQDSLEVAKLGLINTDFTIEAWVRFSGIGSKQVLVTTYNTPGFQLNTFLLTRSSTNRIIFQDPFGVGPTSNVLTVGSWYHVAAVYRHSSTTAELFIDGVSQGTASFSVTNEAPKFYIGGSPGDNNIGTLWFNGYLSNIRITKGVARYTENFDVPTAPFPIYSPTTRAQA